MTLKEIHKYLDSRLPVEQIPLTWDSTGYTSEDFNNWASDEMNFSEWAGDRPTEEEVQIIARLLEAEPGDSLLDVACGYGRHALLLSSQYGLKVTGIDISPGLITTAKRLADERQLEIAYEVRRAADVSWHNEFDRAMIAYNSFSLFPPEDAPTILRRVHEALRPAGRIFLDLDNKSFNCRYGISETSWLTWPGGLTLEEVYFHEDSSVESYRALIFRMDVEQVKEFILFKRIYSQEGILDLLSSCGFQVDQIYGDWDLSPLKENSPKMLLAGVRK